MLHPVTFPAILYVALAACFHVRLHRCRRIVDAGGIAWNAVFAAILAFLAWWRARGFIEVDEPLAVYASTVFACGLAPFARPLMHSRAALLAWPQRTALAVARDAAVIGACAVIGLVCVELPWNEALWTLPLSSALLSLAVIAWAMLTCHALFQRSGAGVALVSLACCAIGIAQRFVLEFKGAAILPSDLLALGTAATVADRYTYVLTEPCMQAIALTALALALASSLRAARLWKRPRWYAVAGANLACAAVLAGAAAGAYRSVAVDELLQVTVDFWQPIATYRERGFIPCFIIQAQQVAIPVPDGYAEEAAQADEAELAARYDAARGSSEGRHAAEAQFSAQMPTVIAIMDESFADLSVYDGLRTGYEGPTRLKSLPDALRRGSLDVSVLGGGTSNTEFEFLTGSSLAFLGTGKYPYTLYSFSKVDTLPRQLGALGYRTTAIHPQNPSNYNRRVNYHEMGFDEFLSAEDFAADAPWLHAGVTDGTTYDKILELLGQDDGPQFIFDVTMQNHGGYEALDVPEDSKVSAAPDEAGDALKTQIDEYASLIEASDRDLAAFIEELRGLDRPVALVFFGDHQPGFASEVNDLLFPDEEESVHYRRLHQTTYLMWTNYDVAGAGSDAGGATTLEAGSSPSLLAAQLLDAIGAPLTGYQRAQLGASLDATAINLAGYQGADGVWYALEAPSPYAETIERWRRVQYLEFAERVQ